MNTFDSFQINSSLYKILPIGSIVMYFSSEVPDGFLECNGSEYNVSDYPDLAEILGSNDGKFKVPDMRECTPVGVGLNSEVLVHDEFQVGQFKDDAFQHHCHLYQRMNSSYKAGNDYSSDTKLPLVYTDETIENNAEIVSHENYGNLRTDEVTRGKSVGTNFIIKY